MVSSWDRYPPDVPGVDHAVDQTVRLRQFRAAHPEWHIWYEGPMWYAEREGDGVVRESLKFLLDELERR